MFYFRYTGCVGGCDDLLSGTLDVKDKRGEISSYQELVYNAIGSIPMIPWIISEISKCCANFSGKVN